MSKPHQMNKTEADFAATVTLPFPPSVNAMYRTFRGRTILSARGRAYKEAAGIAMARPGRRSLAGRVAVTLAVYEPDRRRRDLDNICKAVLDALQAGGVYHDDSQIDRLLVERRTVDGRGPRVVATISVCDGPGRESGARGEGA